MSDTLPETPLQKYARARDAAAAALTELHARLGASARWYDAQTDLTTLAERIERLRDGRFVLAVVGEFSSGKSFLLNALLGKVSFEERLGVKRIVGLLATDINPSTATITELVYGSPERAQAYYPDGREERVPLDRLARFVAVGEEAKLHDAVGEASGAPNLVRVTIDSPFLAGGFVVADTPGLASINPAHRRATLGYLPGADAVLYLVDTQQPFSDGDASFLGIVRRYIESIFIVQTKIDLWQMRDGAVAVWQSAQARIVAQARIHAPGVPVFPLSARDYAEGMISGDAGLIAQSRFLDFLAALDASLVATTGRSRLRRAAAEARRLADRACDALRLDAAAFERDPASLRAARAALLPAIAAVDAAAHAARASLLEAGGSLRAAIEAQGAEMRAAIGRTIARAFDTADIARLRDRAKLHIIVDDTLASAVGRFAGDIADRVGERLRSEAKAAVGAVAEAGRAAGAEGELALILAGIAAERLPITEDAAAAFGADPASGAWSGGLESGLRSSIVFGALGGPAVGLVAAIAARFAAAPYGTYMKRELLADLNTSLLAAFDADIAAEVAVTAQRVERVAQGLAERIAGVAARVGNEAAAPLANALAARERGDDPIRLAADARERAAAIAALATRIETVSETFAREARTTRSDRLDGAAALLPPQTGPAPPHDARFDMQTYEHGLRPERWRVVVTGALRRGKSSLINTIAGERVLHDEGGNVEMRFPVHVRYGPQSAAYALGDDAAWDPIPLHGALDAATRTPVLIETPWRLPHQLVLVHTPAFDSGLPDAEQITLAAAGSASELLALFSRQLSDRELEIYARMNALGKPMSFVHTIADHEASGERRNVVELADRYLRERAIVPQRIFTISTHDLRIARASGQAPAGWNEIGALIDTLTAHAEEHMARLERARREQERLTALGAREPVPVAAAPRPSLLAKIFGRR